jgi:hypothetical protein
MVYMHAVIWITMPCLEWSMRSEAVLLHQATYMSPGFEDVNVHGIGPGVDALHSLGWPPWARAGWHAADVCGETNSDHACSASALHRNISFTSEWGEGALLEQYSVVLLQQRRARRRRRQMYRTTHVCSHMPGIYSTFT